jgi:hypothetical protein
MTPEAFCANITEPTILLGTGVNMYRHVWLTQLGERAILAPPWLGMPCTVQVGALALAQAVPGQREPGGRLIPSYVRPSEAEINWSRGQTGKSSPL